MAQLGMQLASTDGHRCCRCSLFVFNRLTLMPLALLEEVRNLSGILESISLIWVGWSQKDLVCYNIESLICGNT